MRIMKTNWLIFAIAAGLAAAPNLEAQDPPWVVELRAGKIPGPKFDAEKAEKWLVERLKPGQTTKTEVFQLLGDPKKQKTKAPIFAHDLDRPERDEIEVFQYLLAIPDLANRTSLKVQFDSRSGILLDFGISHAICGFCPHIFAHDGENWRLEGKMLAGRIGASRTGHDSLILPRLKPKNGVAKVRISNIAPEIERLHDPQLLAVALREGEELDVDHFGDPAVWTPKEEGDLAELRMSGGEVLVLEIANTAELEKYLRGVFLDGEPTDRSTDLVVDFGHVGTVEIPAVGTKFLRRVVVPIPAGARRAELGGEQSFWFVRRAWTGGQASIEDRSTWISPKRGPHEFELNPLESVDLEFPIEMSERLGFALRLNGFYTFEVDSK